MTIRVAVLPLARPTFDVPFAEEMARTAFASLDRAGVAVVGARTLLFDAAATEAALAALASERVDLVLILQVTFTDATMTVRIAETARAPLAIWAFPEPRAGGRLRLNAFCGLNLAQHALGRAGRSARWLYAAPDDAGAPAALRGFVEDAARRKPGALPEFQAAEDVAAPAVAPASGPSAAAKSRAEAALMNLRGKTIGLVGEHPAGFDTCRYDPATLNRLIGISVQPIPLTRLFDDARATHEEDVATTRVTVSAEIGGIDGVDQGQLDKSLRLYRALEGLTADEGLSAVAVRCWPEMFTEYGCAICGPMGLLTGEGVPCACEADVYGALTSMLLQEVAGEPAWLVDIVDMDAGDDTGVFWHCGSAPLAMADETTPPRAQIHSNRRMPLLAEFTLKPGRITVARISQARNVTKMVLAGAEVVRAPMSFTGTSGVVRFDRPAGEVMQGMMDDALEHHVAIAYGEHREALRAVAGRLGLSVVELA
jgi:L-fucose isomerase-like protein